MERGREVLVGKLAIGRRLLERADAVRCFHASRGEPFWELAVREGLLARAAADDLVRTVDEGSLICRGRCHAIFTLDAANPPADDKCVSCGGPLYVTSKLKSATRETWRDSSAAAAVDEALSSALTMPPQHVVTAPTPRPLPRELADTIPPPPPRPMTPAPVPLPDSLPSAIPIRPRKETGATRVVTLDDTKDDPAPPPPKRDTGFVPFSIGAYEILAPIGKGGMGSVFRARHRAMNRVVAIKIFTSHAATDDEQRKRFDREVRTMAKLDHPGIVRVQGGGVVTEKCGFEGRPYYVMEYVAGRDLGAWVRERPRSPGAIVAILVKICETVNFFHSQLPWIVHRDLKPQNVIVTNDGDVPKLCDFGLAKVEDSKLTRTGDIMGTPQFMPPEQAKGDHKQIGPPTDVYSLGAILYFLLAGEPPFSAPGLMHLIRMIEKQPAPRVRDKNPTVPPTLEAIIAKCLEKDPRRRFHTARDLGVALAGLNLPL